MVYDRQSLIKHRGRRWSQPDITASRVGVIGAGNVGSAAAVVLTNLGFIHVDAVDDDVVSAPNLSRGIYEHADLDKPKASALAGHLRRLNPRSQARGITANVLTTFGTARYRDYDIIVLATHDLPSRRHVNRCTHLTGGRVRAIVEGGIDGLSFSVQTIMVGESPCYACPMGQGPGASGQYVSCNGIVRPGEEGPAPTTGADGWLVGGFMAKEAACIAAGLEPFFAGKELRFDAHSGTIALYEQPWSDTCTDHTRADAAQVLEIDYNASTAAADLRAAVARTTGTPPADVHICSLHLIVADVRCPCGAEIPIRRPQAAPLTPECPACGMADRDAFSPTLLTELADGTLRDYGIPDGQVLEAYTGMTGPYYLVPTDAGQARPTPKPS